MKTTLISMLLGSILKTIPEGGVKIIVDKFLDIIEDYVKKTPNKIDDSVLQLTAICRKELNVPDND